MVYVELADSCGLCCSMHACCLLSASRVCTDIVCDRRRNHVFIRVAHLLLLLLVGGSSDGRSMIHRGLLDVLGEIHCGGGGGAAAVRRQGAGSLMSTQHSSNNTAMSFQPRRS